MENSMMKNKVLHIYKPVYAQFRCFFHVMFSMKRVLDPLKPEGPL